MTLPKSEVTTGNILRQRRPHLGHMSPCCRPPNLVAVYAKGTRLTATPRRLSITHSPSSAPCTTGQPDADYGPNASTVGGLRIHDASATRSMDLWAVALLVSRIEVGLATEVGATGSFRQSCLAKGVGEALHSFRCRDIA
jgi:hypothetical protein